jgi:hypothetical protein
MKGRSLQSQTLVCMYVYGSDRPYEFVTLRTPL